MMMSLVGSNSFKQSQALNFRLQLFCLPQQLQMVQSLRETQKSNEIIGSRLLTAVRKFERERSTLNPISSSSPQ